MFLTTNLFAEVINIPDDFESIQVAIDSSENGDTILVSQGEYQTRINFNGKNVIVASHFILDGDEDFITETILDGSNHDGSIVVFRSGETASLIGFTLRGADTDFGGGIYCRGSSPTISNLIIEQNTVNRNGAGIYVTQFSNPTISNVIIRNNFAGYVGGGFGCYGESTPTLINCTITNNNSDHVGGGLHGHNSHLTLENVTVSNNRALHTGGAIYLTQGATADIVDCILWNNEPHEIHLVPGIENVTGITVSHSIIDDGQNGLEIWEPAEIDWQAGNLDVDPEFEDAFAGDFRLTEDSPAIDAGNPESEFDPDGTRSDMGSIYFHNEDGQHVLHVPDAFETIQGAVDEADDGDIVLVQPGEYVENVVIQDNITVASRVLSTGNRAYTDSTVIDGDQEDIVVRMTFAASSLIGFTVRNGLDNRGIGVGGIHVRGNIEEDQQPLLKHLIVTENVSEFRTGGISCGELVLLEDVVVSNNEGVSTGGIRITGESVTLRNVKVIDNTGGSGGVFALNCDPELTNVLVVGNQGTGDGGGIRLWGSSPTFTNVTVVGNRAEQDEYGNGLTVLSNSHPTIVNSIFRDNNIFILNREDHNTSVEVSYSDIEGGEDGIEQGEFAELIWDEGNINADPQFVDVDNGDFHLTDNSPCINGGDPESPEDPDGTRADMGTFYFHLEIEREEMALFVPDDYETIQEAINASQDGDTILVRPGRYEENIDFNGKDIIVASLFLLTDDPAYIDSTVIDGGANGEVVRFTRQETQNALLKGFIITNGSGQEGGGIYCFNANPTIRYCSIFSNVSENGGGGIFCYNSDPRLINCTVTDNSTEEGGGGMFCKSGSDPTVTNSIFWDNAPEEIVFCEERVANEITVAYSDITGGWDGIIVNDNGWIYWRDGNIDEDPLFADPDEGNYHLTERSPCIDEGDPDSPEEPDGSRADIGAHFFYQPNADHVLYVPEEYETIQAAIDDAVDGDSVKVAPGEYAENIDFSGKDIVVIGNPEHPEGTVINGNETGSVVTFANGETEEASLTGFTLTNGSGTEDGRLLRGGGIFCNNATPVIKYCVIQENSAIHGGGVYCSSSDIVMSDCVIRNNSAQNPENDDEGSGGGIFLMDRSDAVLTRLRIEGNQANDHGAGIICSRISNPIIRNSILMNNSGATAGGGLSFMLSSDPLLENLTIVGNSAENGGGINVENRCDPILLNCIAWNNDPQEIFLNAGSVEINYSDVNGGEDEIAVNDGEVNWGEGNIDEDPLFVDVENSNYHLSEGSPCIDAGDPDTPEDPDGTRADMGAFYIHQFTVGFRQNWNLISINVSPGPEYYDEDDDHGPDVELMMEQLWIDEDNHHVTLMKDERGRFYVPDIPFNNMIPYWDLTRGYKVKVDEDCEATWTGDPIPADADILVNENWNMIAYFPSYELDMSAPDFYGISPIVDHVIILKDSRGRFAVPGHRFSNIPPLRPTQGYYIKVDEDVLFNYPPEQEGERIAGVNRHFDSHWDIAPQFHENMSVLLSVDADDGSQVAAFSGDGQLVGEGVVTNGRAGLAVWGDDPSTDAVEGLKHGNLFQLKLWDGEHESDLSVSQVIEGNGLIYETDDFTLLETVVQIYIPDRFYLSTPYPNPFNSTTKLTYGLAADADVTLQVFDITGRLVTRLTDSRQDAGVHSTVWNATDIPSGIYFVRMKAGNFVETQKLTLLR